MGAGITYSPLGATHHTPQDVAVMSAIPNMSCWLLRSPELAKRCEPPSATMGPSTRIGKAGEPVTPPRPRALSVWKSAPDQGGRGRRILSFGPIMKMAADLAAHWNPISSCLYPLHTLKPLDREGIASILQRFPL
jgi:transketolase